MGTAPVTRKLTNIETNHKCRIDVVNKKSRSIDRFAVISGKAESFTGNIVLFGNLSHDAEISNSSSKCSNTLPMICIEKGRFMTS